MMALEMEILRNCVKKDRKIQRYKDRKAESQKDLKTERRKDRETERGWRGTAGNGGG